MFLKNCWYVAAWVDDIKQNPTSTQILGEKICIFRDSKNKFTAIEDYCPHRRLPLSMGKVRGDEIECGYHGLTFDQTGVCVAAPTHHCVPDKTTIRVYPTVERYGMLWIWMGNPEQSSVDEIIKVDHFDDSAWGYNRGKAMEVACNYQYINDNLLDPSHVAWVHASSFGESSTKDTPMEIDVLDNGVAVSRWMFDREPAPFYKNIVGFDGNCDRLQHYEVHYPSLAIIRAIFTPAGTGGKESKPHKDCFIMDSYNFMTPVDEFNTKYYWFQIRNIKSDDAELSKIMSEGVKSAFEEDRIILSALQKGMNERPDGNINLRSDAGGFKFRRRLRALILEESETADV